MTDAFQNRYSPKASTGDRDVAAVADAEQRSVSSIAVLLGVVSVMGALAIGFFGYRFTLDSAERTCHERYGNKASNLKYLVHYDEEASDEEMVENVERSFSRLSIEKKPPDEHIVIFDESSTVLLDTSNRERAGFYAGHDEILGDNRPSSQRLRNVRGLVQSRANFSGRYLPKTGSSQTSGLSPQSDDVDLNRQQIARFVWVPGRRWVLGVFRSYDAMADEARSSVRTLVVSFVAVCGLLMPLSIMLLHRTIRVAQLKRQQALEELKQSEHKFRTLTETAAAAIFILRRNRFAFVNRVMETITGFTNDELLQLDSSKVIRPENGIVLDEGGLLGGRLSWQSSQAEAVRSAQPMNQAGAASTNSIVAPGPDGPASNIRQPNPRGAVPTRCEAKLRTKAGEERWIDLTFGLIEFEEEPACIGTAFDITERKRAEEELARLAAIVEFSEDAIVGKDLDGTITSWNTGAERIYGYSAEEAVGRPISMLHPAESADEGNKILERIRHGENVEFDETMRVRKDGTQIYVALTVSPIQDANGQPVSASAISRDITERKNLEREILEATGREQQRIGRELHDSVGQELTGASYLAKSLSQKLNAKSLPETETAETIVSAIQQAIGEVRHAIKGLTPVEVDASGLTVALEQLTVNTQLRCGIDCRFECDRDVLIDDNNVATHLFRIAQEAINNAVKHAKAKHIVVNLGAENGCIKLEGRDDGVGITADLNRQMGMGLRIMKYRAGVIGATLDVSPGEEKGTVVCCTLKMNGHHVAQES
jgi:PAS domain S-box-containing protein